MDACHSNTTLEPFPAPNLDDAKAIALRSIAIMADGTIEDFDEVVHPEFLNHEQHDEPPASRGRGPAAFYATALWLRAAFADLRWEIHDVVAQGDLVVLHGTMSGRHVGPFVSYDADGAVDGGLPADRRVASRRRRPTGSASPTGMVIEHWANRDDLGMAQQPAGSRRRPLYLLRMALAKRRARRAHSS